MLTHTFSVRAVSKPCVHRTFTGPADCWFVYLFSQNIRETEDGKFVTNIRLVHVWRSNWAYQIYCLICLSEFTYPSWRITGFWISCYSFDLIHFHYWRSLPFFYLHFFIIGLLIGISPSGIETDENQLKREDKWKRCAGQGHTMIRTTCGMSFTFIIYVPYLFNAFFIDDSRIKLDIWQANLYNAPLSCI